MVVVFLIVVFLIIAAILSASGYMDKLEKRAKGPVGPEAKWYSKDRGIHDGATHWARCHDDDRCELIRP
jgi:hypothetical protein